MSATREVLVRLALLGVTMVYGSLAVRPDTSLWFGLIGVPLGLAYGQIRCKESL